MQKRVLIILAHVTFWILSFYLITKLFGIENIEVYSNTAIVDNDSEKVIVTYDDNFKWAALITLSFCASIFYLNVFGLLKSYFQTKNIFIYLLKIFVLVMVSIYLDFTLNTLYNYKLPYENNWYSFPSVQLHIGLFVFYIVISFAYAFIFEWYRNEKTRNAIKQEKLTAELNFLKSQVNPHFLFNTLNNLFSISQKHNINELSIGINQLSKLMRYMLYESNSNLVMLQKEIDYIDSYIAIQKLRHEETDELVINFEKEGDIKNTPIAPMILLPFVENAFKHGTSINESSIIHMFLKATNSTIFFNVKNKIHNERNSIEDTSGVGLENVKRRLDLIYPNRHSLDILNENGIYLIKLRIGINDSD